MARKPADIYIAIGSNIDPVQNVVTAVQKLAEHTELVAVSTFYRTKPLTRPEQADYRNGVARAHTTLERDAVVRDLLRPIEAALGRVRMEDKHAARTIDLDLAVYCVDGRVMWLENEVLWRNFIAVPLAELAPDLRLPDGNTTAAAAKALDVDGLVADEALTKQLRELIRG